MTATRAFRLALGALGVGVFGYGLRGLLTEPEISDKPAVGEWLVGGVIGHDALLAPVVFLLCAIAYRFTSARWRGRLAALLLIGGSLFLISIPALLRQGLNRNTTVLPLDYARNLGVLLAVLVAAMALYGGLDAALRRRVAIRRAVAAAAPAADNEPENDESDDDGPDSDESAEVGADDLEPDDHDEPDEDAELDGDESDVEDEDDDDEEVQAP